MVQRFWTAVFCALVPLIFSGCVETTSGTEPVVAPADAHSECVVEYIYDGDTVSLDCPGRPLERTRLVGFDTPEVFSPGCSAEKRLGDRATARLGQIVRAGTITATGRQGYDRYGRALVRLEIDGIDVGRVLIDEGLAVPYSGGRRIDWCQRLAT